MPLVSAGIDTFFLASLVTVAPWLYITLGRRDVGQPANSSQQTNSARNPQQPQTWVDSGPAPRRTFFSIFIAVHCLYVLYNLCVLAPPNIFTSLRIPLTEPSDSIRARFLHLASAPALPGGLERLLVRLQSYEARIAYVRFGHAVAHGCEHCDSFDDFALYALPRPLFEYVVQAAVVGIVTIRGTGREGWRYRGLGAVVAAALLETYFIMTADMRISAENKFAFMIHDTALRIRCLFFLVLPPLLHLLPPSRKPPSPLTILPSLAVLADQSIARLQLLRYTTGALSRDPVLRDTANAWWARRRSEGNTALHDPALNEMATKLGLGIDEEGLLRSRARTMIELLKGGFRPSENL
ncbi:hypothetical protein M0805_002803 [Coniferiporia weirii]|nr:hypothetical protein M0805_002803 [Coniferiporia weirii]